MEQNELLKMLMQSLLFLALIIGLFVLIRFFLNRFSRNDTLGGDRSLTRVLSTSYIGVKKTITMVEIPNAILVLGMTDDRITLLSKIEDQSLIESIIAKGSKGGAKSLSSKFQKLSSGLRENFGKNRN